MTVQRESISQIIKGPFLPSVGNKPSVKQVKISINDGTISLAQDASKIRSPWAFVKSGHRLPLVLGQDSVD